MIDSLSGVLLILGEIGGAYKADTSTTPGSSGTIAPKNGKNCVLHLLSIFSVVYLIFV
jgi:hypothetical protein